VNVVPGTVETITHLSPCASGASADAAPSYSVPCINGTIDATCVFWPVWGAAVGYLIYEGISP
jgi:hypothetical protein